MFQVINMKTLNIVENLNCSSSGRRTRSCQKKKSSLSCPVAVAMSFELDLSDLVRQTTTAMTPNQTQAPGGRCLSDKPKPKVHFKQGDDLVQVIEFEDDEESKQNRKLFWEIVAVDRYRFKERISRTEQSLGSIFSEAHRRRIFAERFQDQDDDEITMPTPTPTPIPSPSMSTSSTGSTQGSAASEPSSKKRRRRRRKKGHTNKNPPQGSNSLLF